jgi:hypothetical protein
MSNFPIEINIKTKAKPNTHLFTKSLIEIIGINRIPAMIA